MRVDRLQFGPLFLTDVVVAEFPDDQMTRFEKRVGVPTAGLLGSEALLNYRVGLDYAHSTVYFDIGRMFNVSGLRRRRAHPAPRRRWAIHHPRHRRLRRQTFRAARR